MPFQKGNKLHLKAIRNTGDKHPLFGKHHSEETRKKIAKAHQGKIVTESFRRKMSAIVLKGKDHPNWKGGVTSKNRLLRQSLDFKLWRETVFKRDDYRCVWCGARNGNGKTIVLNADHIKPWVHYPELRFAIDNGRTLCRPCHITTFKGIWKK